MTAEEIVAKLTEVDLRGKSNTHRLDKVEERQDNLDKLVTTVASMATEQEDIKSDVTEIKGDVKALTAVPARHWESFIEKLVWALVAAALGFMLARAGIT